MADTKNVYGFTTTEDDVYLTRVVDEAAEDTDFIFTRERNTLKPNEGAGVILLVRKNILVLGLILPELPLAGRTLAEWLISTLESDAEKVINEGASSDKLSNEWTGVAFEGDPEDIEDELERVGNEIRRIKNIKDGRVVRVEVASF